MSAASLFHPAVAAWFDTSFAAATAAQAEAWPLLKAGRHVLIAAPTGSGKTLAAFLAAIDDLVRQGLEGGLKDETQIVYVSPLKALSNDIQRNLEAPLAGIRAELARRGLPDVEIRTWVRTGDTPPGERQRMGRQPPHIVVTTPESLYILLGSESGRKMLATTRTVIVDEIHALAPNKRGSHLALSLERLAALCGDRLLRIGLSATQKPIEEVARFLQPAALDCAIVDTGHRRDRDLALEVPEFAARSGDVGGGLGAGLSPPRGADRRAPHDADLRQHAPHGRAGDPPACPSGSARRTSPRITAASPRSSGSMPSSGSRRGKLKALVATASLELGIDIGDVDLVCQLGSPRSIASFLQRVGRSGHAVDGTPKGRLFPLSRDELVECAALLDSVRRGELDRLSIPTQPLDVLAQQIVAEVAAREWSEDETVRADPARLALPRPAARGFRRDRRHAGRGLQHAARPARRADPPRRGQPRCCAAGAARG